jgi:hypothetical protein
MDRHAELVRDQVLAAVVPIQVARTGPVRGTGLLTFRRLQPEQAAAGAPPFDWNDPSTWEPVLRDIESAYVVYYPDLAFPKAAATVREFAAAAVASGVRRLVLLSGRG